MVLNSPPDGDLRERPDGPSGSFSSPRIKTFLAAGYVQHSENCPLSTYPISGMPSLVDARAFNAAYHASTRPVAVFVGGTSGIGEHMARRLCNHLHGDLDVVLVGRNRAAAQRILDALPAAPSGTPKPLREFMHCDATLMSDVRKTAEELTRKLGKINFLVLSAGVLNLNGREETTEGLDKKLALSYYSRWKFIHE
jgi:hypothetical protein